MTIVLLLAHVKQKEPEGPQRAETPNYFLPDVMLMAYSAMFFKWGLREMLH